MFEAVKQFLEDIPNVQTIDELEGMLKPAVNSYGIQHFICTNMYGLKCSPDRKPMFGFWNTEWMSHYVSNSYYLEDAITFYNNGLDNDGRPYYWSDLTALKDLTKSQYKIMKEAWDSSLKEGLVIPLAISDSELALVSMAGDTFKKDAVIQGILHTIAIQSHRKARQILLDQYENQLMPNKLAAAPQPQIDEITPAELQIISLLAEDKRAPEIAAIQNISVDTVRKHMASAKKKLLVDHSEGMVITAKRYKLII